MLLAPTNSSPLEVVNHNVSSGNSINMGSSLETLHRGSVANFEHAVSVQGACGKIVIKCRSNALRPHAADTDSMSSSQPGSPDLMECKSEALPKSSNYQSQPLSSTNSASLDTNQALPPTKNHTHWSSIESNSSLSTQSEDNNPLSNRLPVSPPSQSGLKIRLKHTHRSPTDFAIAAGPPTSDNLCCNSTSASLENGAKRARLELLINDSPPSFHQPPVNGEAPSRVSLRQPSSSSSSKLSSTASSHFLAYEETELALEMPSVTPVADSCSHSMLSPSCPSAFLDPPLHAGVSISNGVDSHLESVTAASICSPSAEQPLSSHGIRSEQNASPQPQPQPQLAPAEPRESPPNSSADHIAAKCERPLIRRRRRGASSCGASESASATGSAARESRRSKLRALSFVHSITSSLVNRRRERHYSDKSDNALQSPREDIAPVQVNDDAVGSATQPASSSSATPRRRKLAAYRSPMGPFRIRRISAQPQRFSDANAQLNTLQSPCSLNNKPLPRALRARRATPVPFFLPDVRPKQFSSLSSHPQLSQENDLKYERPQSERSSATAPGETQVIVKQENLKPQPVPDDPCAELKPNIGTEVKSRPVRRRARVPSKTAAATRAVGPRTPNLPDSLTDEHLENMARNLARECEQLERVHSLVVRLLSALSPQLSRLVCALPSTRLVLFLERFTRQLERPALGGGNDEQRAAAAAAAEEEEEEEKEKEDDDEEEEETRVHSGERLPAFESAVALESGGQPEPEPEGARARVRCAYGCLCAPSEHASEKPGSSELLEAARLFSGEASALCECLCHREPHGDPDDVRSRLTLGIPAVTVELCRNPQRCARRLRALLSRLLSFLVPALEAPAPVAGGSGEPLALQHLEALVQRLFLSNT